MTTLAKESPKTKEASKVETSTQAVAVNGNAISREEAINALNAATEGELDSGYLEFEPGVVKRVAFLGWKNIPGMGEQTGQDVPAAMFLVNNGKEQINADAVIVSYFKLQTIGCIRQITCTGVKTSSKGDYKTFKFHELNVKK